MSEPTNATITIVVADDNAQNRALAEATLGDEGYRVVLAKDGAEAIALVRAERPACVLLDVRMPNVDGIAACRAIRALEGAAGIAILFLTAQRDVETFDVALAAGGDDFISKPYRPDELVVRVQTALRLRQGTIERDQLAAELKEQRDRMKRLELQREQLIAFLVHDLKNPVHAIDLDARALARNAQRPERVEAAARRIHEEAGTLMRMITNLLDIAKADEGRLEPVRVPIELGELARAVACDLEERARASGVELELACGAAPVRADHDLVTRVFANLVDNAIRHTPEGGRVTIATTALASGVELSVRDTGPGVPADRHDAVFERYARGADHGATNRGLGLAFCKLAIDAHGGRIWVEDAHPGAIFRATLPA